MRWFFIMLGVAATFLLTGGMALAGGIMATSFGQPLSQFADAIAHAEGFYTVNSRSNRNRNPGDFILAPPASNYTSNSDGTYAVFDTVADGWQALEDELDMIRRGVSHFKATMSFVEMAKVYSPDGWQPWANNVANYLGATPNEQIGAYL